MVLNGIISQKIGIFISIVLRTSNMTQHVITVRKIHNVLYTPRISDIDKAHKKIGFSSEKNFFLK
jgi:hypothetical protein